MRILQTDSEKKAFAITSTIFALLLLLFFFFKITQVTPQLDVIGGEIAINFGTSEKGKGVKQPKEIIQSQPEVEHVVDPEVPMQETVAPKPNETPKVVTQNTLQTPVVKKPVEKEVEKKKEEPTKVEKKETQEVTKPVEAPKPSKSTNDALASFINGPTQKAEPQSGQGNSSTAGDQGSISGDIYSNSLYGAGKGNGSGGGASWGLNGRSLASSGQVSPNCNEIGTVVVEIKVDKAGKVISAEHTKGTTNSAKCLTDAAIATAKTFRWKPDANAPETQIGFIVINFRVGA